MNKDFLEIKMERAAKSGNVDEIKLILDTSKIKEKIDGLGRFSEEEASTFITKASIMQDIKTFNGGKNNYEKKTFYFSRYCSSLYSLYCWSVCQWDFY